MRAWQPLRSQEVNPPQAPASLEAAAREALAVPMAYARRGTSLAQAALAGAHEFREMAHHPRRDVSDAQAGTRFYYHAHRRDPHEHGHFHLFAYGLGEPHQPGGTVHFAHLAALSLNHQGLPTRWFTTNQWVTGEHWAQADTVLDALGRFRSHTSGRLAPVARWLTAMVQLFQPALHTLVTERDAVMARHVAAMGRDAAWADRQLDVLSHTSADLSQRIPPLGL